MASAVVLTGSTEGSGFRMDSNLKDSHASFIGEDTNDNSGYSVSDVGDVNGDGYDDILIGASGDDDGGAGAGQTYLILGTASGWTMDTDLSNADASFIGEDASGWSGSSVAGAGDVNGDGYDDMLIGAYGDNYGGSNAGQTYLILGKASGWVMDTDLSNADASFIGVDAEDRSGWSVSGAGDVNGDGYDDIFIGAYGDDDGGSSAGQTYLILGKVSGWTMETDLSNADASFIGEDMNDYSGHSVSGAGDVNRDGYDDIIIGADGDDDGGSMAGQTYLILGKASGWVMDIDLSNADASFIGENAADFSGHSVSSAGDVNGDGYDDILIGATGDDDGGAGAGQTYLILGKASGWVMDIDLSTADASFIGEDANDYSSVSVSGAGDVNGDGYDDIIIGAHRDDDGGSNAGQTYMILGKASGWAMDTDLSLADASFIGEDANDWSGRSVSGAGDVNGDGYDDILIGVYHNDDGGLDAGQTYLILNNCKPPAPADLQADLSGFGNSIELSWMSPIYWNEPITGYRIYRSVDALNYENIAFSGGRYTDYDVEIGTRYYYSVRTVDGNGDLSPMSQAVSILCELDSNNDGIGNSCDDDDDGDGIPDRFDLDLLVQDGKRWNRQDIDLGTWGVGFIGEDANDYSSHSVSGAGDVNGDGYDDIIIGASGDDDGGSNAGQTYLIFGMSSGWTMDLDLSNADASFIGEDAGDYSGSSISSVGDVNGDGYDDILIGAYENDDASSSSGQTYLILGKASGWAMDTDLSNADASFLGGAYLDFSGRSVSGAGDVNGDGYDDILIGAYGDDDGGGMAGQTYLILGKASGWSMDTDLSNADASFIGEDAWDYSGYSVSGAGDVNGDGYDDILIGAYGDEDGGSNAGQTYLILGKASGWTMDTDLSNADASFWGEDANDHSGLQVSGAGDVNGDGYDDILIGAHGNDDGGSNAGQSYLILGKASGWTMDTDLSNADASFIGEDADDYSGYSVSGAKDVNGDGYDDILIGAYNDDNGGTNVGQTYMILGKASGWAMDTDLSNADASFIGEDTSDYSGRSVSGAGDVNGDGYDDILIGAYLNDDGGASAGKTYLLNRTVLPPVQEIELNLTTTGPGIFIQWEDSVDDPFYYGIYRGNDDSSFYRIADTTSSFFIDRNIDVGLEYHYAVVACCPLGGESQIMETARIIADNDTDGDGMGDIFDWDDDGDGVADHSDAFPLDPTETLDSDRDGIGNNADPDDDNDGIPDTSDTWPLSPLNDIENTLDYMNSTLYVLDLDYLNATLDEILSGIDLARTDISTLSADMYEMEGNLSGKIDDLESVLISRIEGMNSTLRAEFVHGVTGILDRMDNMDTSIRALIEGLWADYNSTSASDTDLMIDSIVRAENNLTTEISDLQAYLETNIGDDISALRNLITLRMDQLELYVSLANSTIHYHLDSIQNDIQGLKTDITTELDDISLYLEDLQESQNEEHANVLKAIGSTNDLITSLNTASMNELRAGLQDIKDGLIGLNDSAAKRKAELLTALINRIDEVNSSIDLHMEEVGNALVVLNKLDTIIDDVETANDSIDVTSEEVKDARSSGLTFDIILLLLLLVVIALLVFMVVKPLIRKEEEEEELTWEVKPRKR